MTKDDVRNNVEKEIKQMLVFSTGEDEATIKLDKSFAYHGLDSLDQVEFIINIEKKFNILLLDEEVWGPDCDTFEKLIDLIVTKLL